jgi:DNA repair protein RecO (recombination protein O)
MSAERATGIILRTRRLTESSLIVHWLTVEHGRIATVAKGALRPKSALRGKLDLFFAADFSFLRNRRSDLHLLREVELRELHAHLRDSLLQLQSAAYAVRLIEHATETEAPMPAVHALLREWLAQLAGNLPHPLACFAFEVRLLRELGLDPGSEHAPVAPGSRKILDILAQPGWAALATLRLSPSQEREIGGFLRRCLAQHTGRLPPERPALEPGSSVASRLGDGSPEA